MAVTLPSADRLGPNLPVPVDTNRPTFFNSDTLTRTILNSLLEGYSGRGGDRSSGRDRRDAAEIRQSRVGLATVFDVANLRNDL